MKTFLQPLQNLAEMEEIQKQAKKNRGILEISGCMESQKAHLMYGLSGLFPCHLVIAADEKSAKELYEDYRFYDKRVYYYPAKDLLFFQADIHGNLLIRQRMQVIRALLEREDEITVVTSIDGCMDYLAPLEKIEKQLIHFRNDSTLDMDKLTAALVHMGYERVGQVEMPGQFSIRGGIIDIYSLTEENPWRIRSAVLMHRASVLLKTWMMLQFILQQNSQWRKMVSHFSIILKKLKLCFFWMNLIIWRKMQKLCRRNSSKVVRIERKRARSVFPVTGCVHGRNCVIR